MKALSVSPRAAMAIYEGEKTIEWRSWNTNYRGDLLICGTAKKEPGGISGKAFFCVELVGVVPFTKEHLKDACMEHMPNPAGYAWIVGNPFTIHPIDVKGQQGLFDVDDDLIQDICGSETDDLSDAEYDEEFNRRLQEEIIPLIYVPAQL